MKKVIVGFAVVLAAVSANANYLFWQLDNEDTSTVDVIGSYIKNDLGLNYSDAGARVVIANSDGSVAKTGDTVVLSGEWFTGPYQQVRVDDLGDLSSYSYYIEVVNFSTKAIYGYSQKQTYADVQGAIAGSMSEVPQAALWHGGNTFRATPEPTSAMLMLLGVAGLALRRKQRKA